MIIILIIIIIIIIIITTTTTAITIMIIQIGSREEQHKWHAPTQRQYQQFKPNNVIFRFSVIF